MSNLEIQREAIIEIVGTQYEGREKNHAHLHLQQKLLLKRQPRHPHDSNAILVLTESNEPLGFLPKGYASLYAPAMDSGKYCFSAEIVKTSADPERPILIVKILAEYKNLSEQDVEERFRLLVQSIENGYSIQKQEYLKFISSETVNAERLIGCLNQTRLLYQLHTLSAAFVDGLQITSDKAAVCDVTKEKLLHEIRDVSDKISAILKKLQKEYDECDEIEDEDEYWRLQKEIRERRKKYRLMYQFCEKCRTAVEAHIPVVLNHAVFAEAETEVETESLPPADPPVDDPKNKYAKRNKRKASFSHDSAIKIVDFENQQEFAFYKPIFFIFNGIKYPVNSWKEIYSGFLKLLYADTKYSPVLKSKIGGPLYGRCIDFADAVLQKKLRKSIKISDDFYAEGNLSAPDIIKHIKFLMAICAIEDEKMRIECIVPDSVGSIPDTNNDVVFPDAEQIPKASEAFESNQENDGVSENASDTQHESSPKLDDAFKPVNTAPFDLKEALVTLLSSSDPRIDQYREHKGGLTSKAFQELMISFYDMYVSIFDISKLLMTDDTFLSVGWGCYILDQAVTGDILPSLSAKNIEQQDADKIQNQNAGSSNSTLAEKIIAIIKQNKDLLQYADGFGAYEVKNLLANENITGISEDEIEAIMAASNRLKEIDDGYYLYDEEMDLVTDEAPVSASTETRRISISLNGSIVRAYDYADALYKICEFAINCKPFRMARIAGQMLQIHEKNVFYRKAVPVEGYHKLSNGLQVMPVNNDSDLKAITSLLKTYCQIDDNMIRFLGK